MLRLLTAPVHAHNKKANTDDVCWLFIMHLRYRQTS